MIPAVQPGGQHPGIVEYQDIARTQKIWKVFKSTVFDALSLAMEDEHPGMVPAAGWLLGDQFRRQVKMEICGSHGPSIAMGDKKEQFTIA
jgi:hypothetical protein